MVKIMHFMPKDNFRILKRGEDIACVPKNETRHQRRADRGKGKGFAEAVSWLTISHRLDFWLAGYCSLFHAIISLGCRVRLFTKRPFI